jgi:MFS family permease
VGRERFTEGQAMLSAAWAIGLLSGPGIGGVLIHAIGAAETLLVEAIAFGVATLLVLAVRTSFDAATDEPTPRPLQAMREGMAVIFRDPLIRVITWTGLPINIVLGGVRAGVPILKTEMGLSSLEAGSVLAAGAAMGLVAVPVVGAVSRRIGGPRMLVYGLFSRSPSRRPSASRTACCWSR